MGRLVRKKLSCFRRTPSQRKRWKSITFATFATVSTAVASATTAAGTVFAGAGFVHGQIAAVQVFSVQRFNRLLRIFLIFHRYKTKTAGAASHAIIEHVDLLEW